MAEMETKKTSTKAAAKVETEVVDPWKEMVKIKLPKAPKGEENFKIVSLNGRTYKIQKGVEVEVPKLIAEIIEANYAEQDKADEYLEALVSKN